jgi:hypothetical protein
MRGELVRAIRERLVVEFRYKGLRRVVNPHLLGEAGKDEGVALSGVQTDGKSSRGKLPVWVFCYLAEITNLTVTDRAFTPDRDFDASDKKFSSVIASVKRTLS